MKSRSPLVYPSIVIEIVMLAASTPGIRVILFRISVVVQLPVIHGQDYSGAEIVSAGPQASRQR
jgi:hypothetical protein